MENGENTEDREKLFAENICNPDMLYLFMVSTFGSDSLLEEKDRVKSLDLLEKFEHGLELANAPEEKKEEARGLIVKARKVINQDYKLFKKVRLEHSCSNCIFFSTLDLTAQMLKNFWAFFVYLRKS